MKMFCYQCQEAAGNKGCSGSAGVCGKTDDTALLQDVLIYTLKGLSYFAEKVETGKDGGFTTYQSVLDIETDPSQRATTVNFKNINSINISELVIQPYFAPETTLLFDQIYSTILIHHQYIYSEAAV